MVNIVCVPRKSLVICCNLGPLPGTCIARLARPRSGNGGHFCRANHVQARHRTLPGCRARRVIRKPTTLQPKVRGRGDMEKQKITLFWTNRNGLIRWRSSWCVKLSETYLIFKTKKFPDIKPRTWCCTRCQSRSIASRIDPFWLGKLMLFFFLTYYYCSNPIFAQCYFQPGKFIYDVW